MENTLITYTDNETTERGIFIRKENTKSYRLHSHTFYEIIYYEPFEGKTSINGIEYSIDTPTIILISPWDIHGFEVSDTDKHSIKLDVLPNKINHMLELPEQAIILKNINENDFVVKLFNELLIENENTDYAFLLASAIIKIICDKGDKQSNSNNLKGHLLAIEAIRILNSNFTQDISLLQLSKQIGVSPTYLSSVFKKETNTNFVEYLCKLRLDYAKKLIKSNKYSISEVCLKCGYRNLSHFLRSFKQTYGMTPKEYQKVKKY